jgi:S1-C subfamily serine protease
VRSGKSMTATVVLTKNELFNTEFKGIEMENIDATDKKKFRIDSGVKIKEITNDNLKPYYEELKGNIILSIDNVPVNDVESASRILNKKDENQSISIEMLNKFGQRIRIII